MRNPRGYGVSLQDSSPRTQPFHRRDSSLSLGEDSDVFEDARETWEHADEAALPTRPKGKTISPGHSVPPVSPQLERLGAQQWIEAQIGGTEITNPSPQPETSRSYRTYDARQVQARPAGSAPLPPAPVAPFRRTEPLLRSDGEPSTRIKDNDVQSTQAKECDDCMRRVSEIWYCNVCNLSLCNSCWEGLLQHRRPGRLNKTPHEKTDFQVAMKIQDVLSPPVDESVREKLYRDDEITSWFGVSRPDDLGPPMFQDYGRFSDLMSRTDSRNQDVFVENAKSLGRDTRTPSLVSFVGQTGAGKSSLIKLLIDLGLKDTQAPACSPVVGPPGAHVPTSDDVHLYCDPRTADSQGPILYADCEGLEGGEREPLGALFRKKRRAEGDTKGETLKSDRVASERELKWASGPRERSREFAVTNLYPRLLYTFSDVIVFVLRNPRVIEHVFERLITWAAAAIETSSNQPVLPHAIIVLNASEDLIDEKLWDVVANTENILQDLANTVNRNETFKKLAQFWRERNKPIHSLTDLILCYYSSLQVLRTPQERRPKIMQEQIEKLYDSTVTACIASRSARNRLRMLLSVEELQNYLQEAFSHYASTLDSPFDFVQASFRNSPIPSSFGGNVLKLALNIMDILQAQERPVFDARRIFSELEYMVASCIMLDNARNQTKGNALKIFTKYLNHLADSLENFCEHHWPCEFVGSEKERCVNTRGGHIKGHQKKNGKVFAAGDFVSSFSYNAYFTDFCNNVYTHLVALLEELASSVQQGSSEEAAAAFIHKDMVLNKFFQHIERTGGFFHSHTACFCCLFGQAEVQLPCGHIICENCLIMYGSRRSDSEYTLVACPIEGEKSLQGALWKFQLKPASAGVRVLTLDGGGIRGIVELEALKALETALGDVPIQYFFDLIVGTSTGGLIALGLASMKWTVDDCTRQFVKLCDEAFTRRAGSDLPFIGTVWDFHHHSKYRTKTLESALKKAFTEDSHLFGGRHSVELCGFPLKVAVTATSPGNRTYVLGNYNRNESKHGLVSYHFQRPERVANELNVFEAARATSAAPRFFKPFYHEKSQKTYLDGAIHHNNPCRVADAERKLLWPDADTPDIFVSIGTGASTSLDRRPSERQGLAKKGIVSHGLQLLNILKKNLETSLDCERIWNDYFASVTTPHNSSRARFRRLNPPIEGDFPALDDKDRLASVQRSAREALRRDNEVGLIARHLLASIFYFHMASIQEEDEDSFLIHGRIRCRLSQPSFEVKKLGQHLFRTTLQEGRFSFIVWDPSRSEYKERQELSDRVMERMIREHRFEGDKFSFKIKNKAVATHINLCFGNMTMFPISGFPKAVLLDPSYDKTIRNSYQGASILRSSSHGRYARGSSRFSHGSRRLVVWEPPALQSQTSVNNLREYGETNYFDYPEGDLFQQAPEAVPKRKPLPIYPSLPTEQQKAEQGSTRASLRKAFRALFWPVKAEPFGKVPEEGDEQSSLASDKAETRWPLLDISEQGVSSDADNGYTAAIQSVNYYHVTSDENKIYQRWVSLLGSSISTPHEAEAARSSTPSAQNLDIDRFEMSAESQPVELPADCYYSELPA